MQAGIDFGSVEGPLESWVATAIVLAAFATILAIALGKLDWMNWRWLTVAGALSYPFYLLHEVIGYTLIHHLYVRQDVSAYVVLPVAVLSMLLLAWLVHRLLERPLAGVLNRWLSGTSLLDPRPRVPGR